MLFWCFIKITFGRSHKAMHQNTVVIDDSEMSPAVANSELLSKHLPSGGDRVLDSNAFSSKNCVDLFTRAEIPPETPSVPNAPSSESLPRFPTFIVSDELKKFLAGNEKPEAENPASHFH